MNINREAMAKAIEAGVAAYLAAAVTDEWMRWEGGKRPVHADVMIKVRYRGDCAPPKHYMPAGEFAWWHDGECDDIIAYRVAS